MRIDNPRISFIKDDKNNLISMREYDDKIISSA
jgi:hypothetical protein